MSTKYVFVTGGVASSLGKGIIASSLAKLLQARGYKVANQKLDPYINIDPGTLNPYETTEQKQTSISDITKDLPVVRLRRPIILLPDGFTRM